MTRLSRNASRLISHPDFLPLVILVLAPVIFFWKVLFLKYDLYYDDIRFVFYNIRSLLYSMGQHGTMYLWNPCEFAGMDCVGDIQKGMFYPLNFPFYLIPTYNAVTLYVVSHFVIQNAGTYIFLRSRGLSGSASVCGSLIFTFSSFTVLHVCSLNYLGTICWMPLLLFVLERSECSFQARNAVYGGLILSLMVLSGAPQMFYYIILMVVLYVLVKAASSALRRDFRKIAIILGTASLMAVICAGLTSIQLLPFLEISGRTFREGGTSFEFANSFCLSPKMLRTLIMPFFYGSPYWGNYSGDWDFFDGVHYFGIFPLFLALPGFLLSKDRLKPFLALLALMAFLTALGKNFILFPLFYKYLPFFGSFRAHCRLMFFVSFAIAFFAASGCQGILSGIEDSVSGRLKKIAVTCAAMLLILLAASFFTDYLQGIRARVEALWAMVLIFLSLALLLLTIGKRIKGRALVVTCVILIVLDLWSFGGRYVQKIPRETVLAVPAPYEQLPGGGELFRICTNTDRRMNEELIQQSVRFGCSNVQGFNALADRDYVSFLFYNETRMLPRGDFIERLRIPSYAFIIGNYPSTLLSLLNVKYFFTLDEASKKVELRKNDSFLPRYFLAGEYAVVTDREKIPACLVSGQVNPLKGVLLEETPSKADVEFVKMHNEAPCPDSLEVKHFSPNKISLSVRSARPQVLFMSEIFYPGWKATIDGLPVKIFRADYIFRALLMPSGSHEVLMWYEPASFITGGWISGVVLLVLIIWGIGTIFHYHARKGAKSS